MSKGEDTQSSSGADEIECPNCGETIRRLADLEIGRDYETADTECGSCEATIIVTSRLTRFYTAKVE